MVSVKPSHVIRVSGATLQASAQEMTIYCQSTELNTRDDAEYVPVSEDYLLIPQN